MTGINLTDEQREVVNSRNKNLIISAQAGAGKTAVLVERVIGQILEDNIDNEEEMGLDRLLIVTFTKKAANSLKEKIRDRLMSMLVDNNDSASRSKILKQIKLIASAHIQTLHAFCYEIIRSYYVYLGMDPAFHIIDSKALKEIQDRALDECLESAYISKDENILNFIELYGLDNRKNDRPIRELILKFSDEMSQKAEPSAWLEESIDRIVKKEYLQETINGLLNVKIEPKLKSFNAKYKNFIDRARLNLPEKYATSVENDAFAYSEAVKEALNGNKEILSNFKWSRVASLSKKEYGEDIIIIKDQFNKERNSLKDSIKDVSEFCLNFSQEKLEEENRVMQEYLRTLASLVLNYRIRLEEKKKLLQAIDFNDIEHLMLDLLSNEEALYKLKHQFISIYFDEYQDASEIQNIIIGKLAREDNLFFVGDVKQSIYGFRQARSDNFLKRVNKYKEENEQGLDSQAKFLTYNFRSEDNILNFVNLCFDRLMTEKRGGVHYNTTEQRARCGKLEYDPVGSRNKGEVKLVVLDTSKDKKDEILDEEDLLLEGEEYINEKSSEAFYLARSIKEYIHEDPKHKYRDIVVLFRKNKSIAEYDYVLRYFGVPTYIDVAKSDLDSLEIELAINLLKVIDRDGEDIALISVLSSIVGDFSDDELAYIRTVQEKYSFSKAFRELLTIDDLENRVSSDLIKKARKFDNRIKNWRREMETMPLESFISKLFDESGIYDFFSSLEHGTERRENLNLILNLAGQYEEEGGSDLFGFIKWIEEDNSSGGEGLQPASELSEADNVVRLMTIHASKGLDSEVVYLVNLSASFFGKSKNPYILNADLGPALAIREFDWDNGRSIERPSYRIDFQKELQYRKEIDEEVRIFYTAMTRPKSRLILLGHKDMSDQNLDEKESISEETTDLMLDDAKSYLDWLLCLVKSFKMPISGFEFKVEDENKYRPWDGEIGINVSKNLMDKEDVPFNTSKAREILSFKYEWEAAASAPIKETVTNILKAKLPDDLIHPMLNDEGIVIQNKERNTFEFIQDTEEILNGALTSLEKNNLALKKPTFLSKKADLKGAELGTLFHLVLQLLPLKGYDADGLKQELYNLLNRKIISKKELEIIDINVLLNFYSSNIGKRLITMADQVKREKAFTYKIRYSDLPKNFPEELRKGKFADLYITLDGRIDLFVDLSQGPEKQNGLLILDFKTDKRMNKERYRGQMELYIRALEAAYGKPVLEAYLYWLRFGKLDKML